MPFQFTCNRCGSPFVSKKRIALHCSLACRHAPRPGIGQPDGSVLIPLSRGFFARVDGEDAEGLLRFTWSYSLGYAVRTRRRFDGPGPRMIRMHRTILDVPDGYEVDHISRDRLDNRRSNLRIATHAENTRNSGPLRNNTSGYRGVSLHRASQRWHAEIRANGRKISLGYFETAAEAGRAFDVGAKKFHGDFSRLNFPDD